MNDSNNIYDYTIYEAQLVHKAPDDEKMKKIFNNNEYIATRKIDGFWLELMKFNDEVHAFSRNISKKTGFLTDDIAKLPHLSEWMLDSVPNGTCIVTEVYVPNGTSRDVTTVLGSLPPRAIAIQEKSGWLKFWAHDLLMYNGDDYVAARASYSRRYSDLCKYFDLNETPDWFDVAPSVDSKYIDIQKKAGELIEGGAEGIVAVRADSFYKPGSRTLDMFKIKRGDTVDCVCSAIIHPTMIYSGKDIEHWQYWCAGDDQTTPLSIGQHYGENHAIPVTSDYYLGRPNAIEISLYDTTGNLIKIGQVSSGFTDADKNYMREAPEDWIGQVVEIGVMSVDKDALSVRHPHFIKRRIDKPKTDCTIESVFK